MRQQSYQRRFEIHVPAWGPVGSSPTREQAIQFVLPDSVRIVQQGAKFGASVIAVNYGGLTERRREFREIDNGVE